jgi:raffinose/stachyose/melibiose transport system substrate-binding protein
MQASIAANTAPDVTDAPQGIGISQLGWLQDLTSSLSQPNPFVAGNKHWQDEYSAYMLSNPEGNGGILASDKKFYEIPIQANYPYIIIGTFYNKDLWAKAGITAPPTTWEQWMQQLDKLKAAGIPGMAPNTAENKSGSIWPLWSTLDPPFTENLALKLDPKDKGVMSNLTMSQLIVSGAINMKDPRMQAPWFQYKRQASYYLPGWNAADIETAWTQGKMAERYGGFWEIPTELSNPGIKFKWGFFAPVPVTTATNPLADGKFTWVATGEAARIGVAPYSDGFGVVATAVKRDNNLDAVLKWLQFISQPQADEAIVNENVTGIPVVAGAHMAPSYNVLNNVPTPHYQAQIFPYQMYNAEYIATIHESVIWLLYQETNASFFGHIQNIITQYAKQTIADNAKKK